MCTLWLQVPLVDLSVLIYCLLRDKLDYSNSMTGCYCEILRSCALCGHAFAFLAYYVAVQCNSINIHIENHCLVEKSFKGLLNTFL